MRTIKFRAWHIEEKKMCEVSIINFESGTFLLGAKQGEDIISDGFHIPAPEDGRFCAWDEFELMQFTGLTDKNGVKIYEGDVIKCISKNEFSKGNINYHEVLFGSCCWWAKGTMFNLAEILDYGDCYVKGNIHENPELIQH